MIFYHLKHLYETNNNTNEKFASSDMSNNIIDVDVSNNINSEDIIRYMRNIFIIFIVYIFISFAAFCYSFYLNQKENQSLPVCIACAFNAAYFNIFYFIFIILVQFNTTSTFRYVEYLEEIDKLKIPSNLQINRQIFDCIRPPIIV
jgi:hypothetical protein